MYNIKSRLLSCSVSLLCSCCIMGQFNSCLASHLDILSYTALATACKPAAPAIKGAQSSTVSPLKRTVSARLRLTPSQSGEFSFHFLIPWQLVLTCIQLISSAISFLCCFSSEHKVSYCHEFQLWKLLFLNIFRDDFGVSIPDPIENVITLK